MRYRTHHPIIAPVAILLVMLLFDSPGLSQKNQKDSPRENRQAHEVIGKIFEKSEQLFAEKISASLKDTLTGLEKTEKDRDGALAKLHERFNSYEDDALVVLILLLPHLPVEDALEFEKKILNRLALPESAPAGSQENGAYRQGLEKRAARYNEAARKTNQSSASIIKTMEEKNPEKVYEVYPVLKSLTALLDSHRKTAERTKATGERLRQIDQLTLDRLSAVRDTTEKERDLFMKALGRFSRKDVNKAGKKKFLDELEGATGRVDDARRKLEGIKTGYLNELSGIAADLRARRDEIRASMEETRKFISILGALSGGANVDERGSAGISMNVMRVRIGLFEFFTAQKELDGELGGDIRSADDEARLPSRIIGRLEKTAGEFSRVGKTLGRGIQALVPEGGETGPGGKDRALETARKQDVALREFRRDFAALSAFEDRISEHILAATGTAADFNDGLNGLMKELVVPAAGMQEKLESYYEKYLLEYFERARGDDSRMIRERYDNLLRKSQKVKQDVAVITGQQDKSYEAVKNLIAKTRQEREGRAAANNKADGEIKGLEDAWEASFAAKKEIAEYRELVPLLRNLARRAALAAEMLKNFGEGAAASNEFARGLVRQFEEDRDVLGESAHILKQDFAGYLGEHRDFLEAAGQAIEESVKDVKRAFKMLNILFGLLPNSDMKMNYLSQLEVRYSRELRSCVTMHNRNYFSEDEKRTTDAGGFNYRINDTRTIKRTDVSLSLLDWDALEYRPAERVSTVLSPRLSVDYYNEEVESYNQWIWVYDAGELPMNLEKRSETTRAYLPWLDLNLALSFRSRYTLGVGGGIMPWSYERINTDINYNRIIVKRLGPPIETEIVSYMADWANRFPGWGYRLNGSLEVLDFLYGDWKLHAGWAVKIGETQNTIVYGGALSNETRKHTLQGIRTNFNFNAYYAMNFLDFLDIHPMLRFGVEEQKVFAGGTQYDYLSYRKYELGIVLRY